MSRVVRVWCVDDGGEEPATDVDGVWYLPDVAASHYASTRYGESDYPEEQTIHVRMSDNTLRRYVVRAEPSVRFRVSELP